MACLGIQFTTSDAGTCSRCGRRVASAGGPALFVAESSTPVCRECGKKEAPPLAALLALAQVAERVGRIKRHTLVPPMEALLELAGAAENYASCAAPPAYRSSNSEPRRTLAPSASARSRRAVVFSKS